MNSDQIVMLVLFILNVAVFAWGLYNKLKGNSASAASELISQIEKSDLLGPEKMAFVVERLYEMIPGPFRSVLNKATLELLAQKIFDYMRKYANAYAKAKSGEGDAAYKPVNDEAAKDVAEMLGKLGDAALRSVAESLGIDTSDVDNNALITQIVIKLMERT